MKKYQKAQLQVISFISNSAIANVSIDDYLTVNGRDKNDIVNVDPNTIGDGFSTAS